MVQSQRPQQFNADRYPGIGRLGQAARDLVAQEAEKQAQADARLTEQRMPQITLALTYAVRLKGNPVALSVFHAVIEAYKTARKTTVKGQNYGATQVAAESVTVDPVLAPYFEKTSKDLADALRGVSVAKTALKKAWDELEAAKKAAKVAVAV